MATCATLLSTGPGEIASVKLCSTSATAARATSQRQRGESRRPVGYTSGKYTAAMAKKLGNSQELIHWGHSAAGNDPGATTSACRAYSPSHALPKPKPSAQNSQPMTGLLPRPRETISAPTVPNPSAASVLATT